MPQPGVSSVFGSLEIYRECNKGGMTLAKCPLDKRNKNLMQNVLLYKPLPGGYLKELDGRGRFKIALISCKRM